MKFLRRNGFTLIELLTVIAITAIMMTVIIIPVIQSFNLMRSAQGFSDAQEKANSLVERISREISASAGILDNSGLAGMVAVVLPGQNGNPERIQLPYTKIDIVKPAQGEPIRGPGGGLINPETGKEDPTLRAPKGQVVLPVAPGSSIVRYFIGLRNPYAAYNNPYDGLLMARNGQRDNLYVLYRAEVQPYVYSVNLGRFVVNKELFYDLDRDNDPNTSGPAYADPDFFNAAVPIPAYALPDPEPGADPDPTKDQMIRHWLKRATVVTEVSRYDMVQPFFNKANRQVQFDGNVPRLYALVQFRPSTVSSEPAEAMTAVRFGEESDNSALFGPDVFMTKQGAWSNLLVRFWPAFWATNQPYLVARKDPNGVAPGLSLYFYDPTTGTSDLTDGVEVFDVDEYLRSSRNNVPYPFSRAIAAANSRSGWITNATIRNAFVGMFPETDTGKILGSFGIEELGSNPVVTAAAETPFPNANVAHMNTGPALTPTNDPNLAGLFSDPQYSPSNGGGLNFDDPNSGSSINKLFNKVWADNPNIRPNVHRFIDLRVVRSRDGSPSPLHPDPLIGFARAKIVPGSEVVIGPDQNPGPNYGRMVRYTRTTGVPGPNQYRINYYDLAEPRNPASNTLDYGQIGFPNPPAVYDPTNFVSAIIQPRYKAGYIQLNSDPNVPLPGNLAFPNTPVNEGNIAVSYRFQMTRAGDTVAVDYDTSQLMQVLLTVKNFPQTTLPNAQSVTLKATASVRNVLR